MQNSSREFQITCARVHRLLWTQGLALKHSLARTLLVVVSAVPLLLILNLSAASCFVAPLQSMTLPFGVDVWVVWFVEVLSQDNLPLSVFSQSVSNVFPKIFLVSFYYFFSLFCHHVLFCPSAFYILLFSSLFFVFVFFVCLFFPLTGIFLAFVWGGWHQLSSAQWVIGKCCHG